MPQSLVQKCISMIRAQLANHFQLNYLRPTYSLRVVNWLVDEGVKVTQQRNSHILVSNHRNHTLDRLIRSFKSCFHTYAPQISWGLL